MISDMIYTLRKKANISQVQLAQYIHVTQGAVSHWERGLSRPSTDQLVVLAAKFGVSVDTLMEGEVDALHEADREVKKSIEESELWAAYSALPLSEKNMVRRLLGLKTKERKTTA